MMQCGAFNDKIEEQLAVLKKELLPIYRGGDVAVLAKQFDEMGLVDTVKVDCEPFNFDFDLKTDASDAHSTDFENVVQLHSSLIGLPPAFAANPNFWAWESHSDFPDYVHNRSETERNAYSETDVLRDFYCRTATGGTRRALVTNPLSRLWWTGRLLRDDERPDDPYHFVRLFTSSAFNSKILLFASSTAANNHENAMGVLDAIEQFKNDNELEDVTRAEILACTKYLNSVGAVLMIDTLGRGGVRDLCRAELERRLRV